MVKPIHALKAIEIALRLKTLGRRHHLPIETTHSSYESGRRRMATDNRERRRENTILAQYNSRIK